MLCIYCHWPREAVSVNLQLCSSVFPRRLKWTRRAPHRAAVPLPRERSLLRSQQRLVINHGQLPADAPPPSSSRGGPPRTSARQLGDGLHRDRRGLLHRVRTRPAPPLPITLCRASPAREECAAAIGIKKGKCISNSVYSPLPSASIMQT